MSQAVEDVGQFACDCCCDGRTREFNDLNCQVGYMRCSGCGCTRVRLGSATVIILRVQVAGVPSLHNLEKAAELARALGAPDDVPLKVESGALHYFEVEGQGAINALEISALRRR